MSNKKKIVKTEFNFGWKNWGKILPGYAEPTIKNQNGDILDIGCATCNLYSFLRSKGWEKTYYGVDIQKYGEYEYPSGINLIIEDPMKLKFPKVDTIILYNILEHIDDPVSLLEKSIKNSKNVLVNIPKRNEGLWKHNIIEYHQLDKTHKHCGFSKQEIYKLTDLAGGKIIQYKEFGEVNPKFGVVLWKNRIPQLAMILLNKISIFILSKIFSYESYYTDIWCEVVKK
jgi:SAM-dependent methyltransferase